MAPEPSSLVPGQPEPALGTGSLGGASVESGEGTVGVSYGTVALHSDVSPASKSSAVTSTSTPPAVAVESTLAGLSQLEQATSPKGTPVGQAFSSSLTSSWPRGELDSIQ